MFIDESQTLEFVRKIMKYKKLLVRFTPLNESPRTLEFNLSGFNSKNSAKLIGVINQLISAENKKIEQAKKDEETAKLLAEQEKKDRIIQEETAKLQAIKNEEDARLQVIKDNEEAKKLLAELELNDKYINDNEFNKIIQFFKNDGGLTGKICEKYGGTWSWHGNINEWKCERLQKN